MQNSRMQINANFEKIKILKITNKKKYVPIIRFLPSFV
jgi:hypothetical protein